jgi:hypothetical protein
MCENIFIRTAPHSLSSRISVAEPYPICGLFLQHLNHVVMMILNVLHLRSLQRFRIGFSSGGMWVETPSSTIRSRPALRPCSASSSSHLNITAPETQVSTDLAIAPRNQNKGNRGGITNGSLR